MIALDTNVLVRFVVADDAEQATSGALSLTSTDLELVNDDATGAGNQIVGIRFNDLPVPRGAIITSDLALPELTAVSRRCTSRVRNSCSA